MSYLYLEPLALNGIVANRIPFPSVLRSLFQNRILKDEEKKALIFDVKSMLRSFNKLSFEEMDLFVDYPKNSDAFFFHVVMLYHLRKKDVPLSVLESFYRKRFDKNVSSLKKEENLRILVEAASSPFCYKKELDEFYDIRLSLLLEVPAFLIEEYRTLFRKEEIRSLLASYWKRMESYSLIPSESDREASLTLKDGMRLKKGASEELPICFYPMERCLSELSLPMLQPKILLSCSFPEEYLPALKARYASSMAEIEVPIVRGRKKPNFGGVFSFIETEPDLLRSAFVKYDKDLVLVFGEDLAISRNPSSFVLPGLRKEDALASSKRILSSLLDFSLCVKKDGYLVFVSRSVTYEETCLVKESFLKKTSGQFVSVLSRFVLPDEAGSEAGYFQIFRRLHA